MHGARVPTTRTRSSGLTCADSVAVQETWLQLHTMAQHTDPHAMALLLYGWGLTHARQLAVCTPEQVTQAACLFKPVAKAQFNANMAVVLLEADLQRTSARADGAKR